MHKAVIGHSNAAERCNLLHRDVSSGNVLILPTIDIGVSKTKGQKISVFWCGLLSDWELAKKIPDGLESPRARQPYRTVRPLRMCYLYHSGLH